MASTAIRLALLVCDTPIAPILAEEGDYAQIYSTWLKNSCPGSLDFVMDAYDVQNKLEYPPDDLHYNGILLTGSAASAYEDVEWINRLVAYVQKIANTKPDTKVFGICFGHQVLGRALGSECVLNDRGWEVGITEVALTDLGRQIFGVPTLSVQEMHRDHVPIVPSDLKPLGSTSKCPNQGMVKFKPGPSDTLASLSDIQILSIQGHPEYTKSIVHKITEARTSKGIISQELFEDVKARNEGRNDGVDVFGKTFWKILGLETS